MENTITMYTSDHGYHLGTYGLPLDKRQPYETDIRVPLLIRGPKIRTNFNQTALAVIATDIAPTILDFAGLNSEEFGMDGISLYPLLKVSNPDFNKKNKYLWISWIYHRILFL